MRVCDLSLSQGWGDPNCNLREDPDFKEMALRFPVSGSLYT